MNKFTSWLIVFLVVCIMLPIPAYIVFSPETGSGTKTAEINDEIEKDTSEETIEVNSEASEPYYPDFPELPAPPAPGSPFYEAASPPPSYLTDENRGSRIKVNTTTVVSIDSPKNLEFVTLGQNFIVSGGIYEDNNSNGKNDTGDIPVPNAFIHIQWAYSATWEEAQTDVNGRFSVTVPNDRTDLSPVAHPLVIEFWGQWTINGSVYYQIPRNITKNIPGYDDDGDQGERTTDGIDNDGDWRGWDGVSWNDDLNHNGVPDFDYDGVPFNDDDGNNGTDEETLNGIDDDNDGLVDEDCVGGDANGDFDTAYDPEPNVDEWDEGIDEEGIPDGMDSDGDTMIDEDCLLPFIPRQNSTASIQLKVQHRTEVSLSIKSETPGRAKIGQKVTLSGQLKAPDRQTTVPGKWIILKFHNNIINYSLTDSEGKYSFEFYIPEEISGDKIDVGRRKFSALFDSTYKPDYLTYYKTSEIVNYLSIIRKTEIELTNVDKNVYLQDIVSITGKVTDTSGDPLLFRIQNDDGTVVNIEPQEYEVTLEWGKRNQDWHEGPYTGYIGPEGNFTVTFTMESPYQAPRVIDVQVGFKGHDKYYEGISGSDQFTVRAHSTIIDWEDVKGFHRGDTAYIRGRLVRQDGSITKGLANAQLEARWGPAGDFVSVSPTLADGSFTFIREIESDHQLGAIVVYMRFDGTDYEDGFIDGFEHTASFAHKTFYVIAQPTITMQGGDVVKGESITLTGALQDDAGNKMPNQYVEVYFSSTPIVNPETGEWDPQDLAVAYIPTDSSGTFNFDYDLPETITVGKAYGAARFKGYQPPYNATNAYDEATTWNVEFNISANTAIVVDQKYVGEDLYRGRDFIITGKVYETFKGVLTPTKVRPIHGEKLKVEVYMRSQGVFNATTHSVGEATVGKLGGFQVRAKVPASIEVSEWVDVTLVFNGNNRYQRTTNTSVHKLWGNVYFERAEILASFPDKDEQGRPAIHEETFNYRDKDYKGKWIITIPVFEDIQGRQPPPVENATIYLNFSGDYFVNTSVDTTDSNGIATFEFVSPLKDKDYPDRIKLLYSQKEAYVLEVTVTFVGSAGLQPATTSFNMTYYPTPPPEPQTLLQKYGTYISILVIITIVFVVFMIVFSSWYIKQQRLRGLKRIIKRAADQLIAGDQYRATIYKSYKKLSAHLRRYGYLRREAETFREFETAIKQALPIDRPSMHRFLDLLEEARYSSHKIGETQRHAAIANLRNIEGSLSQIIIDEEAAMRALRKLEEEEASMAAAETEIIVKPGGEGAAPPSLPPGGAGGPPKLPPTGK